MKCKCQTERPLKDGLKTTVCDCLIKETLLRHSNELAAYANETGKRRQTDSLLGMRLRTVMISLQHICNRLDTDEHIELAFGRPNMLTENRKGKEKYYLGNEVAGLAKNEEEFPF